LDNIFIIHFSPLEFYPPVQNLIRVLEKQTLRKKIFILTTYCHSDIFSPINSKNPLIKIIHLGSGGRSKNKIFRGINYLYFYLGAIFYLLFFRPIKVFYYETLSSFPAFIYKEFIRKKSSLMIHYHEYTSPGEYNDGMKLTKWFHKLEKKLYSKSDWLSQTNQYRIELFLNDIYPIKIKNQQCVPNFPPDYWRGNPKNLISTPVKLIYVGSMSLDTMYTREFAEWIVLQNGKVIWDIYSHNTDDDVVKYIKALNSPFISFYKGIDYNELPLLLRKYDVGVILYNGHIPNYIYNAPNKLFEYLCCGLDVWYPDIMIGCREYQSEKNVPKVLKLDFSRLNQYEVSDLIERNPDSIISRHDFSAESNLLPLINYFLR
jgi:hypothetical protein